MTQSRDLKKLWIRGALLAAALAGCQSGAPTGEPKDDPGGNQDIVDALADLPEAEVLLYGPDGVPQFVVGAMGQFSLAQTSLIADDRNLRDALPPILKVFRLENKDIVLRKINTDDGGGKHYRYNQKFNGLDVVGGDLVVHADTRGVIMGANGTIRGDIAPTLGAVAIAEGAATAAIMGDDRYANVSGRAITASRLVYVHTAEGTLHKAYEQVIEGVRGQDPVQDKVFVDVDNGAVVAVHPQIHFARNRQTYTANNSTSLPG